MDVDRLGERILGCALRVHRALGPGLLENAYESCLAHEFDRMGLAYSRQLTLPVVYEGETVELGYRLDLLVEASIVVEVKSLERVMPVHKAQVLSYLKLGNYPLGYLINFNNVLLKDGISRVIRGA
jgi:GxxExxY protein